MYTKKDLKNVNAINFCDLWTCAWNWPEVNMRSQKTLEFPLEYSTQIS